MHTAIRQRLILAARKQQTVPYSEIAPLANLDMANPDERNQLASLLGEISWYEHAKGRPLLSVLVVHKEGDMIPGEVFFKLATELNHYNGKDEDKFFIEEMKQVFQCWRLQIKWATGNRKRR